MRKKKNFKIRGLENNFKKKSLIRKRIFVNVKTKNIILSHICARIEFKKKIQSFEPWNNHCNLQIVENQQQRPVHSESPTKCNAALICMRWRRGCYRSQLQPIVSTWNVSKPVLIIPPEIHQTCNSIINIINHSNNIIITVIILEWYQIHQKCHLIHSSAPSSRYPTNPDARPVLALFVTLFLHFFLDTFGTMFSWFVFCVVVIM